MSPRAVLRVAVATAFLVLPGNSIPPSAHSPNSVIHLAVGSGTSVSETPANDVTKTYGIADIGALDECLTQQ